MPQLIVLYESEHACQQRLAESIREADVCREVAAYLSQATDLEAHYEAIREAFAEYSMTVHFHELGEIDAYVALMRRAPEQTVVWNLTDGFRYYRGSHVGSLALLSGARHFGSAPQAQLLCQDKFKLGALAASIGLATPSTTLMRDGEPLSPRFVSGGRPLFVKPDTLGAKLGIWTDSRCADWDAAAALSQRIYRRYGDCAVVQAYIPGFDVRVSYMNVDNAPMPERLGVFRLLGTGTSATGGEFMTLQDNRTLSGTQEDSGARTRSGEASATAFTPRMQDLQHNTDPTISSAVKQIRDSIVRLAAFCGLRDYFSFDFRIGTDGRVYFLEFEVCPAVTIYDFSAYLRSYYKLSLAPALARAVMNSSRPEHGG